MTTRAVVIGGGVAGLAAAAALSRHVDDVTVLEKDSGDSRTGVAQGSQLHNLLGRAQLHLEELFPGFGETVLMCGGNRADVASQTHVVEYGVRMPLRSFDQWLVAATPQQVEATLHRLLPSNVTIRQGVRVTGLRGDAAQVTGVSLGNGRISADIVVDACGASTQAGAWLSSLGVQPPAKQETPVRRWYVTMPVHRPAGYEAVPDFWLFFPSPPATAGCLISPLDPRRWLVSASGSEADEIPRDLDGLRRHARLWDDDGLRVLLDAATSAGAPNLFRRQTVVWRRYDEMQSALEGFLPIGDAVAALNPLLGQGMSVAAWQASLLGEVLPVTAAEHHRRTADPVRAALALTQLEEDPVDDGRGGTIPGMRYLAALANAVSYDEKLHEEYVRMWHLLTPTSALTSPAIVDRVMERQASTGRVS